MLLLFKNILFTVFVPGTVAVYIPLRVVASRCRGDRVCRISKMAYVAASCGTLRF
jgi:hypothetical protein